MKSILEVVRDLIKPYIDKNANNIAPVEDSPVENPYYAGDQLIYKGGLYNVTADISIGDTLEIGTNISVAPKINSSVKSKLSSYSSDSTVWDTAPTANSIKPVTSGGVYTGLSEKAPTNHASTETTYGVASTTNYGHVKYGNAAGTACQGNDSRLSDTRTPKAHATNSTAYGGATASNYGHVKLSDSYTSSGGAASASVGASSKAVYDAYTTLNNSKINNSGTFGTAVALSVNVKYTAPSDGYLQMNGGSDAYSVASTYVYDAAETISLYIFEVTPVSSNGSSSLTYIKKGMKILPVRIDSASGAGMRFIPFTY